MKGIKRFFLFVVVSFFAAGCSLPAARQINNYSNPSQSRSVSFGTAQAKGGIIGGLVPVVFVNPSPGVERHVWIFEGSGRVEIIPDPRGGWMFNRPAIAEFRIEPAHSRQWHKEAWMDLPRNSAFVLFEQAERIIFSDPVGQPYQTTFRTGSNPSASVYYRRSPSEPKVLCGGVVYLPHRDPSGPNSLRPVIEINPGMVIKRFIMGGGR